MFPLGRDYLGDNIYMLKGVPDVPTPDNFPAVPIDLTLANWCGARDRTPQHASCRGSTALSLAQRPADALQPAVAQPGSPAALALAAHACWANKMWLAALWRAGTATRSFMQKTWTQPSWQRRAHTCPLPSRMPAAAAGCRPARLQASLRAPQ